MGQMGKAAGCQSGSVQSCERLKRLMGTPQKKVKTGQVTKENKNSLLAQESDQGSKGLRGIRNVRENFLQLSGTGKTMTK